MCVYRAHRRQRAVGGEHTLQEALRPALQEALWGQDHPPALTVLQLPPPWK